MLCNSIVPRLRFVQRLPVCSASRFLSSSSTRLASPYRKTEKFSDKPVCRSLSTSRTRSYCTKPSDSEEIVDITQEREPVPKIATVLGYAGLIPMFAGSAGALWLSGSQGVQAVCYQASYGGVLLSFLGAVHWGLAMAEYSSVSKILSKNQPKDGENSGETLLKPTTKQQNARYILSVVPFTYAWVLQWVPLNIALPGLLIGFTGQFIADSFADQKGLLPTWYMKLRVPLTIGILACLGTSFVFYPGAPW